MEDRSALRVLLEKFEYRICRTETVDAHNPWMRCSRCKHDLQILPLQALIHSALGVESDLTNERCLFYELVE
jgi:hypothetical protein